MLFDMHNLHRSVATCHGQRDLTEIDSLENIDALEFDCTVSTLKIAHLYGHVMAYLYS
jgi:hypothetical protein